MLIIEAQHPRIVELQIINTLRRLVVELQIIYSSAGKISGPGQIWVG